MTQPLYPLWAFSDDHSASHVLVTRGKDLDSAIEHATNSPFFRRGVTIFPVNVLPLNASVLYSTNHASGWLHREPMYEQRKRMKEVGTKSKEEIIELAISVLRERLG